MQPMDFRLDLNVYPVGSGGVASHSWAVDTYTPQPGIQPDGSWVPIPVGGSLIAPLTVNRSIPDNVPWPWHPDPAVSTFRVLVAQASDLDGLELFSHVDLQYRALISGAGAPLEHFQGRVTDVVSVPHELGAVFTITCVDYLSQLASSDVGKVDYPAEMLDDRLDRIMLELDYFAPWATHLPHVAGRKPYRVIARPAAVTNALDMIVGLLNEYVVYDQMGETSTGVPVQQPTYRGVVRAVCTDNALAGWVFDIVSNRQVSDATLPLYLSSAGKVSWDFTIPSQTRLLNAASVEFDSSWQRRTKDRLNRIIVKYVRGPVEALLERLAITNTPQASPPVVPYTIDSQLWDAAGIADDGWARELATFYTPDEVQPRWDGGEFTLQLANEPTSLVGRRYLPRSPTFSALSLNVPGNPLGELVAIADLDARWNPANREWTSGLVSEYTLVLEDSRPYITFTLANYLPKTRGVTGAVFTWDDLPAGLTWDQLDPRDTWDDYRLVRGVI